MPVSHIPSAEAKKVNKSSYRRRKDQNSEISELEALLPWSQKGAGIDKISVLRLTSTFIKFKEFWAAFAQESKCRGKPFPGIERLFSEAIDGFMIILSSNGEVLYVSEGVADYVGVTQQEIIGLSIYELTHSDDHESIRENLKAKGIKPRQFRQFYVRFKSSISPVKKQLSKFGGTIMLQVSGSLKISQRRNQYIVTGLIAECRRIESSSSILEISIPQAWFTSTTTMDLKILSIDTKMSTVTGFDDAIKGTILTDFFHPSDGKKSINCLKMLLITGQASSPIIRFMTHTGEWVWVQIQGLLRYEKDNKTPKYLEANFKLICASDESLTMIEQKELYGRVDEKSENEGLHADPRFKVPDTPKVSGPESIIKPFEDAKLSQAVRDVILHGREEALMSIPMNTDRLASWGEVVESVVAYEVSNGLPPNYEAPYPPPPPVKQSPVSSSPVSTLSPESVNCLSLPPSGSSLPLSHFSSSLEPAGDLNPSQTVSNRVSSDLSATFDVFMPSEASMTTLQSVTKRFNVQDPGVNTPAITSVPPVNSKVNSVPVYSPTSGVSVPATVPDTVGSHPNTANNTVEAQLTEANTMATQHNGPNVVASQYNGPNTTATQYNGANTTATQYNGVNTMATQYDGVSTMAPQYDGVNTMATQYDGVTCNTMAPQYDGVNTMALQYDGVSTMASQYDGINTMVPQYNEVNTMVPQYDGVNTMATQYNESNTMATQYNGPNAVATQYNGPNAIASQYNEVNSVASQHNGQSVIASQHNSPNVVATQYNGPNVMATQYNGPNAMATQFNDSISMASQYNDPFSQPHQYSNPAVGVVANQYVGVQPMQQQGQWQQPHHVGMTANDPCSSTNSYDQNPQQPAPIINMNVTINVPMGVPQNSFVGGTNQLTHQPDSAFQNYPAKYSPNCTFQKDGFPQVGKVESPMGSVPTKPCVPYNVHGTFEVSHTDANGVPLGMKGDGDDILEALQLM